MKALLRDWSLIVLGAFLNAAGVYFFKMPNNFTTGGVSGVSILLNGAFNWNAATTMSIINVVLLFLGFAILGKGCGIRTVIGTLLYSGMTVGLEYIYPMNNLPFTQNTILELAFAIMLPAIGTAILFNIDSSTGGTDIIALIIKKYTGMDSGLALLFADVAIAFIGFFVFSPEVGLLSLLGLATRSLIVDSVIENINLCKYFNIVTTKPDLISEAIMTQIKHGVTVIDARGAYSGAEKYLLLVVCRRGESLALKRMIKKIDPNAFLMITNSSEIIGKGFRGA